jgi:protein-disulfide isomerase
MKTTMTVLRRLALAALAAPLALALVACGSKDEGTAGAPPKGEPVAAVAPPAGKMWSDVVSPTPEGGMRMGNPEAPIKLVEYGSLTCPHCAKLSNDGMQTLVDKYVDSGRVSYEFRSFAIHGVADIIPTVMVRCADPSAFFPLVGQLFATQQEWIAELEKNGDKAQALMSLPPSQRYPALADALGLTDWFAARGLSKDQAHMCLADTSAVEKVASESQKWTSEGINQTPTLAINGNILSDVAEWDQLEPVLQNAGAR